jgi:hypothetical protein
MFDVSQLARTSAKSKLPWREPRMTFIWLRADGPIVAAHTVDEKRRMIAACAEADCVLAVRQVQYPVRQEVMVIDDLAEARRAFGDG